MVQLHPRKPLYYHLNIDNTNDEKARQAFFNIFYTCTFWFMPVMKESDVFVSLLDFAGGRTIWWFSGLVQKLRDATPRNFFLL